MKTIVLCGGGTAGHVMPLVALIPYLKKTFDKIVYFSSGKEIEQKLMANTGAEIYKISPPALKRSLTPKNLLIPFKLSKCVAECKKLLELLQADVVFSKGGYCALPVCIAAKKLNIPYFCHESDLSMGLANKLTYKHAEKLLTVFPDTAYRYGGVCVGAPIREDFFNITQKTARTTLGIPSDKPVLLVTGGSQGSKTINQAVAKNFEQLTRDYTVVHLCGKGNKPAYKPENGYFAYEFADMKICLAACDFALSRGGSNTLFEIIYSRKPALIAPLKKGSRGDQKKNAEYFYKQGAVKICDEDELSQGIIDLVNNLWRDRNALIYNMKKIQVKDGTQTAADIVEKYVSERKKQDFRSKNGRK